MNLLAMVVIILVKVFENTMEANNSRSSAREINISAILDELQRGYDKRVRPNYGGDAVDVEITMYVLSISDLSEVQMDFTLDFYFRQFWRDPRLEYGPSHGIEMLSVGSEFIDKLWVPDTFFANEKKSYFHTATTNNEFLRIFRDGQIMRSMRLTITANCPMNLQYFPMDRQKCTIEIESFGYTMRDIRYKWKNGKSSVGVSKEVSLPQFKVLGFKQKAKIENLTTGNYSRLVCQLQFERSMGYYLIQMYIPSSLIVIISWVSFWLHRDAIPARVLLGVTTVLTMTTLMTSTNAALPKISYIKSIDVFLGTCFLMVFASFLEYASVGYMGKRIQMKKNAMKAMRKLAEEKQNQNLESRYGEPTGRGTNDDSRIFEFSSRTADHHARFQDSGHRMQNQNFEGAENGYRSLLDKYHLVEFPYVQDVDILPKQTVSLAVGLVAKRSQVSLQEVRYRVNDPKVHSKGGKLENTINGKGKDLSTVIELQPIILPPLSNSINRVHGITPSEVDKYSRVVFPVFFVCFNLIYWIIYLHISDEVEEDLILMTES